MAMWHISPGHLEPLRKGQQELGVSFSLEKGLKWSRLKGQRMMNIQDCVIFYSSF